jgi:hypothetical protein
VIRFLLAVLVVVVLALVVCASVGAVIIYRTFCHHDH